MVGARGRVALAIADGRFALPTTREQFIEQGTLFGVVGDDSMGADEDQSLAFPWIHLPATRSLVACSSPFACR